MTSQLHTRKLYILADADRNVLTKQKGFSSEEIGCRIYGTIKQAERYATKFNASIYTVYVVVRESTPNGLLCHHDIGTEAEKLGLRVGILG